MVDPLTVHARDGETLDALVNRSIGRTDGAVEMVLADNPGAAKFTRLPQGMAITIPPAATASPTAKLIDLWD